MGARRTTQVRTHAGLRPARPLLVYWLAALYWSAVCLVLYQMIR